MTGKRVVLHIGTMKSGTTYLQSVLGANADAFERQGVTVVSGRFNDDVARPHLAAQELHGTRPGTREWGHLLEVVEAAPGDTVVVSSEFFSFLGPDGVEAAVAGLAGHDLTVVLSIRDQLGALGAQWQSYTRNRGGAPFASYLRQIADPEQQHRYAAQSFHQAQDVTGMVDRWTRPGAGRLVAVLVSPPGSPPELMWSRFVEGAGLPAVDADLGDVADNQSLGYAACDYLRRLNRHLSEMPLGDYRRMVRPLARDVLASLRAEQQRPRLDRAAATFAVERNREIRDLLARRGTALVGDLADLAVDVDPDAFPDEVAAADRAEVRRCARAVLEYAAGRAGEVPRPSPDIPAMVTEAARLLWPGRAD